MSKTKINDPGAHHAGSGALIRRFLPYLAKYKMTLFLDLFCAALTTLCDIVLPLRYNNDKQKKPLFSRGLSVCRLLFNSFSKLKIDENYKEKRRLFY